MWWFVFQSQVGIAETIYPQRPGQIECDVSTSLCSRDIIIFQQPISIRVALHVLLLLLALRKFSIKVKNVGGLGAQCSAWGSICLINTTRVV